MMNKITLDRKIPFVRAVFDRLENGAPLEPVAAILRDAEDRRGAHWVHEGISGGGPFAYFKPRKSSPGPWNERLKRALQSGVESEYQATVPKGANVGSGDFAVVEEGEAEADEKKLRGLLSECGLVFEGHSLIQEVFVAYDGGAVEGWSNRSWGSFVADWANEVGWQGRRDWEYPFFAFNAYATIERYDDWERVIHDAIVKNTEALKCG